MAAELAAGLPAVIREGTEKSGLMTKCTGHEPGVEGGRQRASTSPPQAQAPA
jgi:hypothetical protein